MKTSLTMTYSPALPVLRVRVDETRPAPRVLPAHAAFGLVAIVILTAGLGAFGWSLCAEFRSLGGPSRSFAPVPAQTVDQWMACMANR